MAVNAEVSKNENETAINLIRRFSKRVQGAGLIQHLRNRRYFSRPASSAVTRKRALKTIKRREEVRDLIKRGLMSETPLRRGKKR